MDEPLSNLDAKLRVQMRAEIAKLQHELGTTTIYVTHDQIEAMTMGDRVAVMSDGRPPAGRTRRRSSTTRPANLFVAGFIGTPPMNLFADQSGRRTAPSVVVVGATRIRGRAGAASRYPGVRELRRPRCRRRGPGRTSYPAATRPDLPTIDGASSSSRRSAPSHGVLPHRRDATVRSRRDARTRRDGDRPGGRRRRSRRARTSSRTFPPHVEPAAGATASRSPSTSRASTSSTRRRVRRSARRSAAASPSPRARRRSRRGQPAAPPRRP